MRSGLGWSDLGAATSRGHADRPGAGPRLARRNPCAIGQPAALLGFRDPDFLQLCDALQAIHRMRRNPVRAVPAVASVLAALPAGRRSVSRLPILTVRPTDTVHGHRIRRRLSGRACVVLPRRLAVAVVDVQCDPARYTRGRSKQALRTNCRRATESGISCRPLDADEAVTRVAALLAARGESAMYPAIAEHLDDGSGDFWLAEDPSGDTVVIALTTTDGPFSRLEWMTTAPREERSDGRYLMSSHLVTALAERGVEHLGVDSTFLVPPGLRYFQHLLGFRPTNIVLDPV